MSSSRDAGYHVDQAQKQAAEACKKSPTGKHETVLVQKDWRQCKHCGADFWSK